VCLVQRVKSQVGTKPLIEDVRSIVATGGESRHGVNNRLIDANDPKRSWAGLSLRAFSHTRGHVTSIISFSVTTCHQGDVGQLKRSPDGATSEKATSNGLFDARL
jgi:hypothetical protein